MENNSAGIIGAGIGGLSTAIRLAVDGYKVTVFEANSKPGGKASQIFENGFRFDTGPSLLTMLDVLQDLFNYAGENIESYLQFDSPEIICKYFYEDGTIINAFTDHNKFAEEISNKTSDDASTVKNYLAYTKKIYDLTADMFLHKSLSEPSTYFASDALNALKNLRNIDMLNTMNKTNSRFFNDARNVQLFNRYGTYTGSNPYTAPATLNVIQYLEYLDGVYISKRGIYSIVEALYNLALKKGVKFNFNTKVDGIIKGANNKVKGIKAENKNHFFNLIISNVDEQLTEQLLGNEIKPRKNPSTSGIVFYWGVNKSTDFLETHNILFSKNYSEEFNLLYNKKVIPDDPTVYIYISSKFNKEDAPDGCENWYVMINTPALHDNLVLDTNIIRKNILSKINRILKIDLQKNIVSENINTPIDLESKTGALWGSIYGNSSNNKLAAFLRKQNRSKKYKDLYYAGGTVHPGGGIPLVILSAKITSELIGKYHDKG